MQKTKLANLSGRVWKFENNCDTGQIIPGRYLPLTDPAELATHVFEDIAPHFRKQIRKGDIIVAGSNFGCGSSREHAPKAIKWSGISAVIADSFARIFYRNALNVGLVAIPVPGISDDTDQHDTIEIDLNRARIYNRTKNKTYDFTPFEAFMIEMLEAGGIVDYTLKKLQEERNQNGKEDCLFRPKGT